ncbi:hypothetical protein GIB67_029803 [Kingdonia uniflora]|uniref:Uncharacterized protein n=1 Tax=Kingdonia uniflora TaxID=39325 RepID=A0A7J7NJ05_9MAGN|nr:hypothetical protein GIB67_029803 [Kingdonia uniflora]
MIIAILDPDLQVSFYRSYNMTVGYIDDVRFGHLCLMSFYEVFCNVLISDNC